MSGKRTIAKRIVFRLDPGSRGDGGLQAAARMARAFHAELAARLISDTRIASALTFAATSAKNDMALPVQEPHATIIRRAQISLRQIVVSLAEREQTSWTFATVECSGVLAEGDTVDADDLVAIELPRVEVALGDLRLNVESALTRARGVILFPADSRVREGPIVVIETGDAGDLIERSEAIASALDAPLIPLKGTVGRNDPRSFASDIRSRSPALVIVDAGAAIAGEFVARPRFLRELGAPLLLLKTG